MTNYIKVDWPESQKFMEFNEIYHCNEEDNSIFVPEDLYEELKF